MPEGPEVKTIVKQLQNHILNKPIVDVVFGAGVKKLVLPLSPNDFAAELRDQSINRVNRCGKYIDFELSGGSHLVFHLLITGRLSFLPSKDAPLPKYFRCAFVFEDGSQLCLGDQRRWTKLRLFSPAEFEEWQTANKFGVDALSENFTLQAFTDILDTSKAIHTLLLDQKKISGLGNIYANEVLFDAGIHPKTPANAIPEVKIALLFDEIRKIMAVALKEGGTTIASFTEKRPSSVGWHLLDGSPGGFWKHVRIFDKAGESCPTCDCIIEKDKVGGRSVYFCPGEQILP